MSAASVGVDLTAAWAAYEVRNQRAATAYEGVAARLVSARLVCRHEGCDRDYGSAYARNRHEERCRFREAPAELST